MKKIFILIILFSFQTKGFIKNDKTEVKLWGYVLHSSKLSRRYIKVTIPKLHTVSITGYRILGTTKIRSSKNRLINDIKSISRSKNVELYPLITFHSIKTGRRILNSKKFRKKLILNIINLVNQNHFKGIHLDFEYLPPAYSKRLRFFLKELKNRLPGKTVTMAVFPQVGFPKKWSDFHNLKNIHEFTDEIVLMCYDYHRPGTAPGPVTGYSWAEKNIIEILKYFKSKNVWLGIPAYGYRWPSSGKASAISAR
ncbi:glycosyl hydrolase family 18 protein, partial [Spirochaetota bacterium]